MTAHTFSETLNSLWHGLMGLVLMLLAMNAPKGPPSAPSAQLAFPFMAEQKASPRPKWKRLYPYASLPKAKRKGGAI